MSKKKRIFTLGIGLLGNWALTWVVDFGVYPFVISISGILWGGLIMTAFSFVLCYFLILFYDGTKRDWLGIETLKGIEEFNPKPIPKNFGKYFVIIYNTIGQLSAFVMRKSDALLMVVLSIKFDPFITVIHIRHGAHQYNGLSKRDWKIFISSLIISNAYWTLVVFTGITIVEVLWGFLAHISIQNILPL